MQGQFNERGHTFVKSKGLTLIVRSGNLGNCE